MFKAKKMKAWVLTAVLLAGMMAGCGQKKDESADSMSNKSSSSGESSSSQEKKKNAEPVTLQVLSLTSNTSGLQENTWWSEILKEKVGVQLELLPAGDQGEQKLQALMASGSLPDIVVFKDPKQVTNAVAGDLLLSFEDYKELVPDIYKNAGNALQYSADALSDGKGKPYSVGIQIASAMPAVGNINWGPRLRYDLYKQVGSPEIGTLEDYLGVLKQMQDLYPANADGKKVYGFSIWPDWDQSNCMVATALMGLFGGDCPKESSLVYKDVQDSTVHSLTEDGGKYFRAIRFFYEANQMGLMDPDSLTQRFDDAQQKFTDGRALFDFWTWGSGQFDSAENHANKIGFMPVAAKDAATLLQQLSPIGSQWSIAAGSSTKYPEQCMKYINFMYSDEGLMEMMNGPKGVIWDINAEGIPELTEEGYTYVLDSTKEIAPGGKIGDGIGQVNLQTLQGWTVADTYGVPFDRTQWPTFKEQPDNLRDEWRADMGARDEIEYLTKYTKYGIVVSPFAPMEPVTDKMKQIEANAGSVIQQISWKMIFAKDDAEYESLKKQMIEQADSAGINEYLTWFTEEFNAALERGSKYTK